MRRLNEAAVAATFGLGILAVLSVPARAQVTVFEGARLIVGDGRAPIENGDAGRGRRDGSRRPAPPTVTCPPARRA